MDAGFAEFVWIWNTRQGQATPRLHLRIARWLAARWQKGERELLLLAFRSSGKSTLVGLFCAWLLSHNPDLRILVLAGDFALAKGAQCQTHHRAPSADGWPETGAGRSVGVRPVHG